MKALTLAIFLSATLSSQPADRAPALEDYAFSTGLQAYVYGYPLVLVAAYEHEYFSSRGMSVNLSFAKNTSDRSPSDISILAMEQILLRGIKRSTRGT